MWRQHAAHRLAVWFDVRLFAGLRERACQWEREIADAATVADASGALDLGDEPGRLPVAVK